MRVADGVMQDSSFILVPSSHEGSPKNKYIEILPIHSSLLYIIVILNKEVKAGKQGRGKLQLRRMVIRTPTDNPCYTYLRLMA